MSEDQIVDVVDTATGRKLFNAMRDNGGPILDWGPLRVGDCDRGWLERRVMVQNGWVTRPHECPTDGKGCPPTCRKPTVKPSERGHAPMEFTDMVLLAALFVGLPALLAVAAIGALVGAVVWVIRRRRRR